MDIIDDNIQEENNTNFKPWGMETNQFCMLLHLSQLAGYIIPLAGIVLPIVMWATNKEHSNVVDKHGKNVLNWMISSFLYLIISSIFILILIGIPLLIGIAVCSLIFSIIGAIKASDGIIYNYPLSIQFIK